MVHAKRIVIGFLSSPLTLTSLFTPLIGRRICSSWDLPLDQRSGAGADLLLSYYAFISFAGQLFFDSQVRFGDLLQYSIAFSLETFFNTV